MEEKNIAEGQTLRRRMEETFAADERPTSRAFLLAVHSLCIKTFHISGSPVLQPLMLQDGGEGEGSTLKVCPTFLFFYEFASQLSE